MENAMKGAVKGAMKPAYWGASIVLGAGLLLSACGGGSGGAAPGSTTATCASGTVCGTAATGAAMVGASVSLKCKSGVAPAPTTTNNVGYYSVPVAAANLPCAVQVSQGSNNLYSFANSSGQITNVTPLTTLAMTQILGTVLDTTSFDTLNSTLLERLNSANSATIDTILDSLRSALASYALPPGFNPITTPLTAAAVGQAGNAYDGLLDQFAAANPSLATLLAAAAAAAGTMPVLGTPDYSDGAATIGDFFTKFAGDYTLEVSHAVAEGANDTAVTAMFPIGKAIKVHLKANGDISIDGVGRTLTYLASTYAGNTTSGNVMARTDFIGSSSTQNEVRYRSASGFLDLYLSYNPSTGRMELGPQGFVNNEGYASLHGNIVAPPASLPTPPAATCSSGDDKLVFTNGPTDFCGFTRNASATTIAHYFEFTSAAGSSGVTYVKFETNSDDSAVEKVTIENDDYAFGCGGALAACTGVSISSGSSYKQFTLSNTALAAINGASTGITVNGLLIHPVSTAPAAAAAQPITLTSIGNNKGSSDIAPLVGAYTGNLGMALTPDAPTVKTNTCSIEVLANGKVTVSAGEKSISATFDGGIGDNILNPSGTYFTAVASDLSLSNYVRVSLQRGYITKATASHSTDGLLDSAPDRIDCLVFNPNPTTLGSSLGSGNLKGGATASDLPSTYAGTYSNGTCSLTISNDATFTVTVGSNVVTAQLAGDEDDHVTNNTSEQVSFLISDSQADIDGKTLRIQEVYRFADGHFQIGSVRLAASAVSAFNYPACGNLVKQ